MHRCRFKNPSARRKKKEGKNFLNCVFFFFIRQTPTVYFFSRLVVFLLALSFRRGGRDLGCTWRQAEGGVGVVVVAGEQSTCCCSGYLASGAPPLAAEEQPFTVNYTAAVEA